MDYIDIKSYALLDTLRKVLHNVPAISIMEEKLSVRYPLVKLREVETHASIDRAEHPVPLPP
jgi:hypothetical protein